MSWFSISKAPKPLPESSDKLLIPDDIWTKCPECEAVLYTKELNRSYGVCQKCGYHFRIKAQERIPLIVDKHSFEEIDSDLHSVDPLNFKDVKKYKDRLKRAEKETGLKDAVLCGRAKIKEIPVVLGVFEFLFIGGSMGSVVGEKLVRMIELAIEENRPAIIISASGGARMQEGILSLMQMAKVSAALARLAENGIPYISVLTNPTTGGVAASLAMLGDVIIAEPKAVIGFAGARVIERTIKQELPAGFQRSEFLLEHGMVDRIVHRSNLRDELELILKNFGRCIQ